MTIENQLKERSNGQCELCLASEPSAYAVPPDADGTVDQSCHLCETCQSQIDDPSLVDVNHWRCLNDSMWSQVPAVQVLAWRMLTRLRHESWPQDLLDMLYLDDETLAWAKADGTGEEEPEDGVQHLDSSGVV